MDHEKHYNLLIERARNRVIEGYRERHHILPRCVGGTDDVSNLVDLTAEEHYVAHQLLAKMYKGTKWYSDLIFAVHLMTVSNPRVDRSKNKTYGWVRRECAKASSEKMKGHTWNRGKVRSQETRKLLSEINLANPSRGHQGKKHSEETKMVWSEKRRGRKWVHRNNEETQIDRELVEHYLGDGWKLGRLPGILKSENNAHYGKKGKEHPVHGLRWVTRGQEVKKISKEELSDYLSRGWTRGRKVKEATL